MIVDLAPACVIKLSKYPGLLCGKDTVFTEDPLAYARSPLPTAMRLVAMALVAVAMLNLTSPEAARAQSVTEATEEMAAEAPADAADDTSSGAAEPATVDATPETAADPLAAEAAQEAAAAEVIGAEGLDETAWEAPEQPLSAVLILVDPGMINDELKLSDWLGRSLLSQQGTEVGTISDLLLASPRQVSRAIVRVPEGALGLRGHDILVPTRYIRPARGDDGTLTLTLEIGDRELATIIEALIE